MEYEHAASLTARAVKKALPDRAVLTKDARKTINSAVSVFTLYLASIAHETSIANKRNMITLNDVLKTLQDADLEHFIEPIEACLQEAKAAATRKKNRKEEEGAETTSEVAEQLEEVAIDTTEEDADEGEDVMSTDEPLDAGERGGERDEDTEAAMQDKATTKDEPHNHTAQERAMEEDDSAEPMELS